ncbi:hypothetical protein ACQY0O_002159 [Thecaphora frezii]
MIPATALSTLATPSLHYALRAHASLVSPLYICNPHLARPVSFVIAAQRPSRPRLPLHLPFASLAIPSRFSAWAPSFSASAIVYERIKPKTKKMAKPKGGFYAVQRGRARGVYTTWAECEANVRGFPGAVFKRFDLQSEAEVFARKGSGLARSSSAVASSSGHSPQLTASSSTKRSLSPSAASDSSRSSSKRDKAKPSPLASASASASASNPTFPQPSATKIINVYVDGSGLGNGNNSARAGWGVYWEDESLHNLNEARRLPGPIQTNNRGELMAMIRAVQLCPDPEAQLVIHTDSQYSMDCVDKWISGWRRRKWLNSTGQPVLNRDLIRRLDREMAACKLRPKLNKVAAHAGIEGNEMADRLAKHGASLPSEMGTEDLEPPPSDDEAPHTASAAAAATVKVNVDCGEVKQETKRPGDGAKPTQAVKLEHEHEVKATVVNALGELEGLDEAAFMTEEELRDLERGNN